MLLATSPWEIMTTLYSNLPDGAKYRSTNSGITWCCRTVESKIKTIQSTDWGTAVPTNHWASDDERSGELRPERWARIATR